MYKTYSVLMSVYFKENSEYLKQSIDSMLQQTVPTNDFVLVCDGPLGLELDYVIDTYQTNYPQLFHIIKLPTNQGLGNALNIGITYCKNELIARMDSDDISVPKRCQMQLDIFNSMSEVDVVSGFVKEFKNNPSDGNLIKKVPHEADEILKYSKIRSPFNHPCVMYKKSAVKKAGSYRDFLLMEDYDLWIRMLNIGCKGYNIQEILLEMRAGKGMYKRRGNWQYLKSVSRFRCYLKHTKYINWFEFLLSWGGHVMVWIMPNKLRMFLYGTLLRKKLN